MAEASVKGRGSRKEPWTLKTRRGRFAMYVPPVLEAMGLAEVEHNPKNNRVRAA